MINKQQIKVHDFLPPDGGHADIGDIWIENSLPHKLLGPGWDLHNDFNIWIKHNDGIEYSGYKSLLPHPANHAVGEFIFKIGSLSQPGYWDDKAIPAMNLKINTNTNNITSNASKIATLQTDVTNLKTRMNIAEGNITTLSTNMGTRMLAVEARATTLEGKVTTLESKVATLESKVATLEVFKTSATSTISGHTNDIQNILGRLAAAGL